MATLIPQTVFTKTAKGILEIRNKSSRLPRELVTVLEGIDGTATMASLQSRSGIATPQLHHALQTLVDDGYIKPVAAPTTAPPPDPDSVAFDPPDEKRLALEASAHALAGAEAAKLAHEEGRAALEARLRADNEGRARSLAESRLHAEAQARAAAEDAARAAQLARDRADAAAAAASDAEQRAEAQASARSATAAALRARAEAQVRAEAEERARALVEEKRDAEQRARDEAEAHAAAERRAHERAAEESRARDALRAHAEAAGTTASQDALRMDNAPAADLAQRLTARVTAERKAREEAGRRSRSAPEPAASAATTSAPLELASITGAALDANDIEVHPAGATLPAIDLASSAGPRDQKHVTPDHVPSALERAMMEREARAKAEASAAAPATPASARSSPPPAPRAAPTAGGATTLTARTPQPTYEAAPDPLPEVGLSSTAEAATPAPGKIVPTLADEGPLSERLNVDRTAHEVMQENVEQQRQAEVAALSRRALDMRRQREEENARRVAREQSELRRRKLGRGLVIAGLGIPLLAVAWLQFVPLNGYVPDAQSALSARLNQPTTISTVRYVLLPTPRIVLENVRIGSAQAVHIDRIDARAWPMAFLSEPLELTAVEARGVDIDPGMLATIPAWTGGRSANTVHVAKLKLTDVKLGLAKDKMEGMNGEIVFAANGTVQQATLSNENLRIDAAPTGSGVRLALSARDWRVPFGPALTFGYLTVEGVADRQRFATTRMEGRIGGGTITGSLAARWDTRTTVGGELTVQGVRVDDVVQQVAPGLRVKGVLAANLRYAMQADTASGLMERPLLDGTFALTRGELGGVDLARSVQLPGTAAGGRTAFDALKGSFRTDGTHYSYRNLQLSSGPLDATGSVDAAPGGQLNGRVDARVTARSAVVARASFSVRGTVKEPQLVQ